MIRPLWMKHCFYFLGRDDYMLKELEKIKESGLKKIEEVKSTEDLK